jgi:DnaJ-class molecular chaperone
MEITRETIRANQVLARMKGIDITTPGLRNSKRGITMRYILDWCKANSTNPDEYRDAYNVTTFYPAHGLCSHCNGSGHKDHDGCTYCGGWGIQSWYMTETEWRYATNHNRL